ncbi:GFA family protein [Teredinibacter turnerae]|uniref:GFA family protein n=1 Tax=Teredinibacter turnerae TaxID=2426 RepID=UPI00037935AF|nr:GFA family protein [Teredinibacter turnerae]
MEKKIEGSCLCGNVKISSDGEPQMTAVCHCKSCQKQTGTAFSIVVGVAEHSLQVEGVEFLGEFAGQGDSGSKVSRKFCKNCGSPVFSVLEAFPGAAFIKAGTLEDTSWLVPNMHMWCDASQPWISFPEDIPCFAKNPVSE